MIKSGIEHKYHIHCEESGDKIELEHDSATPNYMQLRAFERLTNLDSQTVSELIGALQEVLDVMGGVPGHPSPPD